MSRTNLRRIWNSIFYILISGARWKDVRKFSLFAHRTIAHRGLIHWQKIGIYDRVLSGLLKKATQEKRLDL